MLSSTLVSFSPDSCVSSPMRSLNFTNTQVASSETARDINRSVVLNLIRRRQPISRADLARVSGLQRSTVSLITKQLIREKWVVKGPVGRQKAYILAAQ